MKSTQENHFHRVSELQSQLRRHFEGRKLNPDKPPLALAYGDKRSYTIRSKAYKDGLSTLYCGSLKNIIHLDPVNHKILVEPLVTMEMLSKATLPYGLTVPVITEIKDMTVGGALMGGAAESTSHRFGCLNDVCTAITILCGNGDLLRASREENSDVFYGLSGSYGSLGLLVSAEFKLIPAPKYVHLQYLSFPRPDIAIETLKSLYQSAEAPDFLEGFVFSKDLAVIAIGNSCSEQKDLPNLSLNHVYSKWYYQHVYDCTKDLDPHEEIMDFSDYLFRHDQGAFWMGAYLLHPSFFVSYIVQGILGLFKPSIDNFNENQIARYRNVLRPSTIGRTILHHWMNSRMLQKMLHKGKSENWIQNRIMIQDFCLPEENCANFLNAMLDDPNLYPLWICPVKATATPQIFSPHLLTNKNQSGHFINIGIYGIPAYSGSIEQITRKLESLCKASGGRKVLYARTYYSEEEFWDIYSLSAYETLRNKLHAKHLFHDITEKVLSM